MHDRRSAIGGWILAFLIAAMPASRNLCAQTYRATSLGANTFGTAINTAGQVVGYTVVTGMDQPFVWANGTLTFLNTSGGFFGQAFGINDSGQIVGVIAGLTGSRNPNDAVLWVGNAVTNLGSSLTEPSTASGINSSGQVVGAVQSGSNAVCSSEPQNAYIWSDGVASDLDASTSITSIATAINSAGDTVGLVSPPSCGSQAALFAAGTTTLLPQVPGAVAATESEATAVNNAGQIVGYAITPDVSYSSVPLLWYHGAVSALPGIGQALSINNSGQIVGENLFSTTPPGQLSHAALWTSSVANPLDLNDLIDPATPLSAFNKGGTLVLISATAINDNGWIVAAGSVDGGTTYQSFLLQPETLSLDLTPSALIFASQRVSTTSAPQAITVENSGATAFNLSTVQVSGDFSETNDCGASVANGASCAIQIKFAPTLPGNRTGVLTIASGGTNYTVNLTGTATISLTLTATATSAAVGTAVTLTWTSPGTTCTASGGSAADGWLGNLASSGSKPVTETTAGTYTYGISCAGGGQSATAQVVVSVGQPTVSLGAAPTSVTFGDATTLTWTSTFSTSCTASGGASGDGWSGSKSTSGKVAITESASGSYSYTIACGTASVTAENTATVTVNAVAPATGGGGAMDLRSLGFLLATTGLGLRRRRQLNRAPESA